MLHKKKRIEKIFIIVTFLFSYFFIGFLYAAQYPEWWQWLVYEQVPLTWLEASLLLGSSFFASNCYIISFLNGDKKKNLWLVMTLLFFLLALDERFALHERLRDLVLAPYGIRLPLINWTSPGDFILLLLMVIGLLMMCKIITLFRYRKLVLYFFITGVAIASLAILLDSLDMHVYSITLQRVEQFTEEVLETTAMLFFLNSFFLCSLDMIYDSLN
jgi:hypothetical protein